MESGVGVKTRRTQSMPLWMASRSLLGRQGEEFFARWEKTAKSFEEDEVHDLRVASRRLREGLALFSSFLPGGRTGRVVKKVKKVTGMLGVLRNTDEAVLFFSALTGEDSAHFAAEVQELLVALRRERQQAHKKLKKELGSLNPDPLRKAFQAIRRRQNLFSGSGFDQFVNISSFANDALQERAQLLVELLPQALQEADREGQHRLRIALKKMRYRVEILASLMNKSGYDRLHDALKGYQDVLGKLHDIDVFCDLVQERVPSGAGRDALLRDMAGRRSLLFASFLEMLKSYPVESIGVRARDALLGQELQVPSPLRRSLGKPQPQIAD